MADEGTAIQPGQSVEASPATPEPLTVSTGQPQATEQTSQPQTPVSASDEDVFFDPRELDPALMPAYKQLQRNYTKKMEAIKQQREKIEAYDNFSKDPLGQIQSMASRMGYQLTRAEAQAIQNAQEPAQNWEPQTWDEVMTKAEQRVMEKMAPVLSELQTIKRNNLEKMLDDSCPDWRTYEDDMAATLKAHPTLAADPVKLYRLSVPEEVLTTRATQQALKKLQTKVDANKISGTSTTKQTSQMPDRPLSFDEAVSFARGKLAEQGIRSPR